MSKASVIERIDELGLCLGCGFCESVCGKEFVKMEILTDGFIHPVIKQKPREDKSDIIQRICPAINLVNDISFDRGESVWGHIEGLWSGYSTDHVVRTKGSSGGIVSGIAIYVLEHKIVNAVIQVGGDSNDYTRNTVRVSYTKEDVLTCASSRYAPAGVFSEIFNILDSSDDIYMFIGKPCDVSGLKNFLREFPQYEKRFELTVSIICAGMPSFKGTEAIVNEFKAKKPVTNLVYRGNGWPGYFSFRDYAGTVFQKTYNDSWGKVLNRHLNVRCKVCPDGIGIQADIAVGDAWETADGYPDFTEKEGQSLVIARTKNGTEILKRAEMNNAMVIQTMEIDLIKKMQPYQYHRRTRVGARLFALYLRKGVLLNYKNVAVYKNLRFAKITSIAKEFLGTYKRLGKKG